MSASVQVAGDSLDAVTVVVGRIVSENAFKVVAPQCPRFDQGVVHLDSG